jgi:hypothetical protein
MIMQITSRRTFQFEFIIKKLNAVIHTATVMYKNLNENQNPVLIPITQSTGRYLGP